MKPAIRWIQNYLLAAAPFVIGAMIWSSFVPGGKMPSETSWFVDSLWHILGWNLLIWFVMLLVFFVTLALNRGVREQTLKRIAQIKDGDEREEWITGRASKSSYIATLSLLILLIFLSLMTLQVEKRGEDSKRAVALGLNFSFFETREAKPFTSDHLIARENVIFENRDIPLTKTGLLLIILFWQMGTYYVNVRRELAE